jgi:hypothetical protein
VDFELDNFAFPRINWHLVHARKGRDLALTLVDGTPFTTRLQLRQGWIVLS